MSLHDRIKEARKHKGITQTELGNAIGVAKTTIAGYEKNREPTAAQLGAIADILEVDVTFLLQDEIKRRHDESSPSDGIDNATKKSPSTAEAAPGGALHSMEDWKQAIGKMTKKQCRDAIILLMDKFMEDQE